MQRNIGTVDRAIRAVIGVGLLGMGVAGGWGWIAIVLGVVVLGTVILGWCPPYALLGINTCGTKSGPPKKPA